MNQAFPFIYPSSSLYPGAQWRGLLRAAAKPEQTHHTRFHLPRPTVTRKLPANRPPPITPLFIPPASLPLTCLAYPASTLNLPSFSLFLLSWLVSFIFNPVHFPLYLCIFHSAFLCFCYFTLRLCHPSFFQILYLLLPTLFIVASFLPLPLIFISFLLFWSLTPICSNNPLSPFVYPLPLLFSQSQ